MSEWQGAERRNCELLVEKIVAMQLEQQKDLKELTESVKDIVAAHRALKVFGRTVRWIAGTAVAMYAIWYVIINGRPPP